MLEAVAQNRFSVSGMEMANVFLQGHVFHPSDLNQKLNAFHMGFSTASDPTESHWSSRTASSLGWIKVFTANVDG